MKVDVATDDRNEGVGIHLSDPAGILDIMPVHITPDGRTYAYGYRRFLSDRFIATSLL